MRQSRKKFVHFRRFVKAISVFLQESSRANEVVVVLKVLGNGFCSKLNRWSSNEKMRKLAEGWMLMRNNLKQGFVSVTRILMQDLILR